MSGKNIKNIIIIILSIAVIALGGYLVYDKVTVKNDKKVDSENNKPTEGKNYVYGYIAVNKDNVSKVVELHKNSENKVLASYSDRIYSFTQKQNKLYYYTQGGRIVLIPKIYINS